MNHNPYNAFVGILWICLLTSNQNMVSRYHNRFHTWKKLKVSELKTPKYWVHQTLVLCV